MFETALNSVEMDANGGDVFLNVSVPDFPERTNGNVWEYDSEWTPVGVRKNPKTGKITTRTFTTSKPEVTLGAPEDIASHRFLIEGAVVGGSSNPTPYRVKIVISQSDAGSDGTRTTLHEEWIPADKIGFVGAKDVPFSNLFEIVA